MLRNQRERADQRLVRREPNEFGVRCGESQADGVPCPDPDCRCDDCRRAFMVTLERTPKTPKGKHA